MNCEKCGGENISTERTIEGFRKCLDCGHRWRNVTQSGYIVTNSRHERAYRRCKCCVCGTVKKCTPSFDFYTTDAHGESLVCERCFHEYLGHRLNNDRPLCSCADNQGGL